jgi:hypothetical protein
MVVLTITHRHGIPHADPNQPGNVIDGCQPGLCQNRLVMGSKDLRDLFHSTLKSTLADR